VNRIVCSGAIALFAITAVPSCVQAQAAQSASLAASPDFLPFPPLEQWKSAVLAGNAGALKALYSSDPPAAIRADGVTTGADADVNFWISLKAKSIAVKIAGMNDRHGGRTIIFEAEVQTGLPTGEKVNVTNAQGWRMLGDQWRIAAVERTDSPALKQPSDMNKNIYPDDADAHAEIKEAEERAASAHKRLLLVFGANWCFDCHVLDLAFHRSDFAGIIAASYEVVHVDLGLDAHKNSDLVRQYEIPLDKGIPALAVVESDGKLVVSQKNGEFEDARGLTPDVLLEFLNQWKPQVR
jgi:hypothetical protein